MFKFSFFQSKLCFAYLRLIRPNQLETTFTGKKSTGGCLKYNIFEFVFRYILPWLNGLGSYVAESGRAVRGSSFN